MQKKAHLNPENDQKAKKKAILEATAGQNAKNAALETEAGQNAKKMQKFCNHCRNHKNLKNWEFPGAFAFFFAFFAFVFAFFLHFLRFFAFFLHRYCVLAGLCFQGCICLHFGRPSLPGLRFFFAFWSFSGFRCAFFLHFAGPRASRPTKMQKQCNAKFRQGSKRKKKTQTANAKKMQHAKKCKQQMQKKCKQQMENTGVDNNLGVPCCSLQRFL